MRRLRFRDVSDRAKLYLVLAAAIVASQCAESPAGARVTPSYDLFTNRLILLVADQNGDGRPDQWTYLDGNRPLRGEADRDGDGRIDRWEYFGPQAELVSVGTSSQNDGIEDTWAMATRLNGEGRVDISLKRDRQVDRHEYYQGTVLARAELDLNADGLIDRWDRYESGVLREVQFDSTLSGAKPDWRVLYDEKGRFVTSAPIAAGGGKNQ